MKHLEKFDLFNYIFKCYLWCSFTIIITFLQHWILFLRRMLPMLKMWTNYLNILCSTYAQKFQGVSCSILTHFLFENVFNIDWHFLWYLYPLFLPLFPLPFATICHFLPEISEGLLFQNKALPNPILLKYLNFFLTCNQHSFQKTYFNRASLYNPYLVKPFISYPLLLEDQFYPARWPISC